MSVKNIRIDRAKLNAIEAEAMDIYRLITFSRHHYADDLLDNLMNGIYDLGELVSIKNAQMEAVDEEEVERYLKNLKHAMNYVFDAIRLQQPFESSLQLFALFRLVSPEAHQRHPNQYRKTNVQIGNYICPEPRFIEPLVHQLFENIKRINDPVIRAIYFHHELVRIHPFVDGNGRVARVAKNWMLMYNLYPPIFINVETERKKYINTLSSSFSLLHSYPLKFNAYTASFFEQEIDRLHRNVKGLKRTIFTTVK